MKYLAYFRFRERHYKNIDFIETTVGLAQATSETIDSYGVTTIEISGRDIGVDLECLVKANGWRKASTVVDKYEHFKELTEEEYKSLIAKIK